MLLKNLLNTDIRILDLSSNKLNNKYKIINFIENSKTIKELYLRNILFSDIELENILNLFYTKKTIIYNIRLSIKDSQL